MVFRKKRNRDNEEIQAEDHQESAAALPTESRDADFSILDSQADPYAQEAELISQAETPDNSETGGQLDALRAEVEIQKDKYLRALAEFENYKKRTLKERSDLIKYQGEKILFDLLDVVDNLELALQHSEADPLKLKEGIKLIHKLFTEVLQKWDVRGESSIGAKFDPTIHNAISRSEDKDAQPGTIVAELKKAYFYKNKLLRPAEVVVVGGKLTEEQPVSGSGLNGTVPEEGVELDKTEADENDVT